MSNHSLDNIDPVRCRARIEHEDGLLNQRTGLFLTANGPGSVAVGLIPSAAADLVLVLVVIIANILWLLAGVQTVCALRGLTTIYIAKANDRVDGIVRNSLAWAPRWLNVSNILGLHIPLIVTVGWIVGLAMLVMTIG